MSRRAEYPHPFSSSLDAPTSAPCDAKHQPSLPPRNAETVPSQCGPLGVPTSISDSTPRPPRRRPIASRPITSCEECRRRKIGCSKTAPCGNCMRYGRRCEFVNHIINNRHFSNERSKAGNDSKNSFRMSPSLSPETINMPTHAQQTQSVPQDLIGPWGSQELPQVSRNNSGLGMEDRYWQNHMLMERTTYPFEPEAQINFAAPMIRNNAGGILDDPSCWSEWDSNIKLASPSHEGFNGGPSYYHHY